MYNKEQKEQYNENTRVQVPAAIHLCRLGYDYLDSIGAGEYEPYTNILVKVFKDAVARLNPEATESEIDFKLSELVHAAHNDDLGREFYQKITTTKGFRFIDFSNPGANLWHCTTEFECKNPDTSDNFRPDITCFVNGLPLAFIEVKKPNNHDGMLAEKSRFETRLRTPAFRSFFNVTQLTIYSNNQEYSENVGAPIQGAFYATTSKDRAFFNLFREPDPDSLLKEACISSISDDIQKKILLHRHCLAIKTDPEFETNKSPETPTNRIITSLLSRDRFLFLLRYSFAYVERKVELSDGSKVERLEKHIMRYQQLFATFAIQQRLSRGAKGGVIWHTQGSGKTALAYYNVKYLTDFYAKQNTIAKYFFIVDRLDLLEQAADEFASRGLRVQKVQSRDELMKRIKDEQPFYNPESQPEINVVNIQKFKDDKRPVVINTAYSTRLQRVFFIDEAHRGYSLEGSFLANLIEADKNAVKIALTGTPLLAEERATWKAFGKYIHAYYYDKSIADGYTLKLLREDIETEYREKIEGILERLAGEVQVKKSDIKREKIIEHPSYLNAILDYILPDFRKFRIEKDCPEVGGMIVCETNEQARSLYQLFQEHNKSENLTDGEKQLNAVLILHDEGDKATRNESINDFKKKEFIDVLIVNRMLLTGFDAPRLKRLYLLRKLEGHDLLQALTRVNRPYKNFIYGYIVDFADVKENFEEANNRYLKELREAFGGSEIGEIGSPDDQAAAILVTREEIEATLKELNEILFDYTTNNKEEFRKELDQINDKERLIKLRRALNEARAIINQARSFGDEESKKLIIKLAPKDIPQLLAETNARIDRINLQERANDHSSAVTDIINAVLAELKFDFHCVDKEELNFLFNDYKEQFNITQREFEANFDPKDEKYVSLSDEFRTFFRKRGYSPQSYVEAKEYIGYMKSVVEKIREINRLNNALRSKYRGDEKFARIHKRIREENARRTIPPARPVISQKDTAIMENLNIIKGRIDDMIYSNVHILENRSSFEQDVLSMVSKILNEMKVIATIEDRKFIQRKICEEYLSERLAS